jgi:hypothetical protein
MDDSIAVPLSTKCDACYHEVVNDDVFCANCGYPLKGTALEQRQFIGLREVKDIDLSFANKEIRKAGYTLFYISGLFALGGIIVFFTNKDNEGVTGMVVPIFILSILFLLLGEYSKKKPLACIISGICLYAIVQVLEMIGDPASIARGFIGKIIIIGFLIKGVKSAMAAEKIKKENNIA